MIHPPSFHACGEKRMMVTEHVVSVPLSYPDLESPQGKGSEALPRITLVDRLGIDTSAPKIDVYFTIVEMCTSHSSEEFHQSLTKLSPQNRASQYTAQKGGIDPSKMILYLQGGPGFGSPTPISGLSLASKGSWAAQLLEETNSDGKQFQRVVLMDQRGTGRSTPVNKRGLMKLFPDLFNESESDVSLAVEQLSRAKFEKALNDATFYLTKFRADSIVRDAEWIKDTLVNPTAHEETTQPWGACLGQSFGGFCIMTYLSSIANPPKICLLTGGIAPMNTPAKEVYDRLWFRVKERSMKYYEQYPGDVNIVKRIVRRLLKDEVRLNSGGVLTARRFLQLGLGLGGTPGVSFATLHSILNSAFIDESNDELSHTFLKQVENQQSFDDAPLYFLLHESIYADGPGTPMEWAAHTSYETICASDPEFDYKQTCNEEDTNPTLFFGEMVFPWMTDGDHAEVSGRGMRLLSETLASKADWLPLFDAANMRSALVGNDGDAPKTKAAGAVYYDDMYVDFDCCMKLVRRGEPLEGLKVWVTNEYQHSGLRDDGANIVKRLLGMAKGSVQIPS